MEQKSNVAAMKDVLILLSKEECALGMGQKSNESSNDAAVMGAQIKLRKEEFALGMGQRSNYASVEDV
jgi:hypothetical protein